MADFCKQCSIEMFGEDSGDLAMSSKEFENIKRFYVICEGCGPTAVDPKDGTCVGDCMQHHGTIPVQTLQEHVDGLLPGQR